MYFFEEPREDQAFYDHNGKFTTREKNYIECQFESEWDYPGEMYEIEDPKILQLEKENQELKKKINELLSSANSINT
jgi:hypothetical protein